MHQISKSFKQFIITKLIEKLEEGNLIFVKTQYEFAFLKNINIDKFESLIPSLKDVGLIYKEIESPIKDTRAFRRCDNKDRNILYEDLFDVIVYGDVVLNKEQK